MPGGGPDCGPRGPGLQEGGWTAAKGPGRQGEAGLRAEGPGRQGEAGLRAEGQDGEGPGLTPREGEACPRPPARLAAPLEDVPQEALVRQRGAPGRAGAGPGRYG